MAKIIEWNRQAIILNALKHRYSQVENEIAELAQTPYSKSFEIMNRMSEKFHIQNAISELTEGAGA